MYQQIAYEVEAPIATLTLSRPERRNAWTARMGQEVQQALVAAEKDPRVVAITFAGMSLCVRGHAEEFRGDGIAVNALWPRSIIATAAVENLLGGAEATKHARRPEIMADAVYATLCEPSHEFTGHFCIDDDVLRDAGVVDLDTYA
jgi:enoyl-CoA hydratase/carnithine racemase